MECKCKTVSKKDPTYTITDVRRHGVVVGEVRHCVVCGHKELLALKKFGLDWVEDINQKTPNPYNRIVVITN